MMPVDGFSVKERVAARDLLEEREHLAERRERDEHLGVPTCRRVIVIDTTSLGLLAAAYTRASNPCTHLAQRLW
jgi:hypothetical protein